MADAIRVCVSGYRGRVGLVLVPALQSEPGIEYVGGIGHGDGRGWIGARLLAGLRVEINGELDRPGPLGQDREHGGPPEADHAPHYHRPRCIRWNV